ncbi:MAG TPA: phospholipase D-like domain-containing protein [Gemmatimonadaceae bacterium]|nr:phospholipase D-like domain-containing protein [Gemmatimonadaceae bacterium]
MTILPARRSRVSPAPAVYGTAELRVLARQTFERAAGAPLVEGNAVRLLRDAAENYPAWLAAIHGARRRVDFEMYILHDDEAGEEFAAALAAKAGEGVRVRLLYDWMGALGATSRRFWRRLERAGVEVRVFNPLRFTSPVGWVSRDHRKTITVDGTVAFVSGLCVGRMWVGDPARGIEPWRDTGVEIRGPAVADVERAFAQAWATAGPPDEREELETVEDVAPAGDVAVRIVATMPGTTGLLRLDQLIAGLARDRLWLSDAYFVGTSPYVQALCAAALDGVDVRILLPDASDIPILRPLTRSGYQPLLEAGVRIFEWRGPMMHAKSAVADDRWARVGSTNLNIASWMGNWELDVSVEDAGFAREMAAAYEQDLARATEVVLDQRRRVRPAGQLQRTTRRRRGERRSGITRAATGAIRLGNTMGAAVTSKRVLERGELRLAAGAGVLLLALTIVVLLWPRVLAVPVAVLALWGALALLVRAMELWRSEPHPERSAID